MTRKWIPVWLLILVMTGLIVAGQARDREKRLVQSLRPLVKDGTACITESMQLALDPHDVDYDKAVQRCKRNLFELEQRIHAVEQMGDDTIPQTAAALVYLKSGQSVVRELYRNSHAAQSLDSARLRIADSRSAERPNDQDAASTSALLERAQRDVRELHLHHDMTASRLTYAARMLRKNIVQYQASLGSEYLAPPELVTTLIARTNQAKNR